MVEDLIADAMTDALDISVRHEPVDLAHAGGGGRRQPTEARRRKEAADHHWSAPACAVRAATPTGCARRSTISSATPSNTARSAGRIELSLRRATRTRAVIRVADQGPGLSPEDIGRLFGRFQRLSAKPTGGESSTGLGLSIAKRIIELHNGRDLRGKSGSRAGRDVRDRIAAHR